MVFGVHDKTQGHGYSLIQEIFQQFVSVLGQDGFRVKLETFDRQSLMAYAHDFAIFCPGGNFQTIRKTLTFNDKRMIARRRKRIWQVSKHACALVENG